MRNARFWKLRIRWILAHTFRAGRKKSGLSIRDISAEMKVSRWAYLAYEFGLANPSATEFSAFCRMVHISPDYLLFPSLLKAVRNIPLSEVHSEFFKPGLRRGDAKTIETDHVCSG